MSEPLESDPGSSASRTGLWLVALALMVFLVGLGARDLWNPNEPIYGRAVVEMAEAGDWLVPTLNGETFSEKPILYYWGARTAGLLFGSVDEFTLRLPSVLAGVLSVLLTYLLVLPYAGRRQAFLTGVLLMTQYQVWWAARSIQMDVLVLAATVGAIVPIARMLDHGLRPRTAWLLTGAAVGLGFAGKGPVAILVPGLAVLAYLVVGRRPFRSWLPGMPWAALAALVVGSPWFIGLWLGGRQDVLIEVLYRQNFERYVDAWDHLKPWWYYVAYFWSEFFPWSWLVPVALWLPMGTERDRSLRSLAWSWIVAVVVFFSLSESKRAPYMLPIAPAVAILAAAVVSSFEAGTLGRRAGRAVSVLLGFIASLAAVLGGVLLTDLPERSIGPVAMSSRAPVAVAALVTGIAVWLGLACRSRWPRLASRSMTWGFVLILTVCSWRLLPALDDMKSAQPLMAEVASVSGGDREAPLASFRIPYRRAGYVYYWGSNIRRLDEGEDIAAFCSEATSGSMVLVESGRRNDFTELFGPVEAGLEKRIGSRTVFAFSGPLVCDAARTEGILPAKRKAPRRRR